MEVFSLAALIIYCTFLSIALLTIFLFGEGNLDRYKMTGPFEVGHKDMFTTEGGIECSCYYPVDRDEFKNHINESGRNT